MYDQQQNVGEKFTARGGLNFLYLLVSGHATCLTPFMRRGFGSEALGLNGIAALVIILLYAAHTGSQAMISFLVFWLFALLLQRIKTGLLWRQGVVPHSRYDGEPWLALKLVKSEQAARGIEPFICLAAGVALSAYDEALGAFVFAGLFSFIIKLGIERRVDEVSVQRMRDAEIEQRWLVQQNKKGRRTY